MFPIRAFPELCEQLRKLVLDGSVQASQYKPLLVSICGFGNDVE